MKPWSRTTESFPSRCFFTGARNAITFWSAPSSWERTMSSRRQLPQRKSISRRVQRPVPNPKRKIPNQQEKSLNKTSRISTRRVRQTRRRLKIKNSESSLQRILMKLNFLRIPKSLAKWLWIRMSSSAWSQILMTVNPCWSTCTRRITILISKFCRVTRSIRITRKMN